MKQFLKRLMLGVVSLALFCSAVPMAFAAPNYYTIYLEPQGGAGAGTQIYVYQAGGAYRPTSLPNLTMDGYTFDGWYDDTVGGEKITTDYNFKYDGQTIYAHWTADTMAADSTTTWPSISLKGHLGTALVVGTTVLVVTLIAMNT